MSDQPSTPPPFGAPAPPHGPPPSTPPQGPPQTDPFGNPFPGPLGGEVGAADGTKLLVISILGFCCCFLFAIYSLIEANKYRVEATTSGRPLDTKVQIALVLSIVAIALWVLSIVLNVAGVVSFYHLDLDSSSTSTGLGSGSGDLDTNL